MAQDPLRDDAATRQELLDAGHRHARRGSVAERLEQILAEE